MSHSKPAAYRFNEFNNRWAYQETRPSTKFNDVEPLYTKEQLRKHVEMTHAVYNQFCQARRDYSEPYRFLNDLETDSTREKFDSLFHWIYSTEHGADLEGSLAFYTIWVDCALEKYDIKIDIVPEKKWFVRSKNRDGNERFSYIKSIFSTQVVYGFSLSEELSEKEDYPYQFDTKEQAEEWTNPLTKAVLLPVEGEQ